MSDTKKVKITHSVDYKGTGLAAGVTAELETAVAERLIAAGHAVEVDEKKSKKAQ